MPNPRFAVGRAARVTAFMCCVFSANGAIMPFLAPWLEARHGLSGAEISAIVASPALARVLAGPVLAAIADAADDRRTPLRVLAALALLGYGAVASADGFWGLLAAGFLAGVFTQAASPLAEGLALRVAHAGAAPFGVMRAIGSGAFVVANVAGGALIARFGLEVAIVWILGGLAAATLAAFALPRDDAPLRRGADGAGAARLAAAMALLRNPRFVLAMAAAGVIQSTHGFYYAFSTLVWAREGIGKDTAGLLWAVAVSAEIAFLTALPLIERRFPPERLLLVGAAAAAVRWAALALSPPLWLLVPLQALHAFSFAASHVGALRIVFRETPDAIASFGQSIYAALGAGTLLGVAILASGVLYDRVGAGGYWAMAVLAAVGLALTARLLGVPPPWRRSVSRPAPPPSVARD